MACEVARQVIDDLPQLAPRHWIDAHRRLVEQQQLGGAQQCASEAEFLLHAARQPPGASAGERPERGHVQELGVARRALGGGHALQIGVEVEVLLHAEVFIEAEALRHVADARLHGERIARDVDAERLDAPGVKAQQPSDQPHQRRLARAVRADQSGDRAARGLRRQAVERHDLPLAGAKDSAHALEPQRRFVFSARRHRRVHSRAAGRSRSGRDRSGQWRASPAAARPARRRRKHAAGRRARRATPATRRSWG